MLNQQKQIMLGCKLIESSQSENMYKSLPQYLYRYLCFDDQGFHLRLFTHNELFCASPKHFNDPFDCKVPIDYSKGTKIQMLLKLEDMIRNEHPDWSRKQIREKAKHDYKSPAVKLSKDPQVSWERIKEFSENFFGIVSFSEDKNNLLMWGHYANAHTGFLVEFDAHNLKNFLSNFSIYTRNAHMLYKVEYANYFPIIDPYNQNFEHIKKMFLTKSDIWVYEKEWRIVFAVGADRKIIVPDDIFNDIVKQVIIGLKANKENREQLISILEKKNILYKTAVQSNTKYELNYV